MKIRRTFTRGQEGVFMSPCKQRGNNIYICELFLLIPHLHMKEDDIAGRVNVAYI